MWKQDEMDLSFVGYGESLALKVCITSTGVVFRIGDDAVILSEGQAKNMSNVIQAAFRRGDDK